MIRQFAGLAVLSLIVLAGCTPSPAVPADTRDADAKAIRDGEATWNKDWATKDIDRIVSHYADDASVEVPNVPIMTGKDAIRTGLKEFMADPNLALTFQASQVEVAKAGDLAYTRGTYSMTMTDPTSKQAVTERGKYVTLYRKQPDGSWKAVEDINNADSPATAAK
jgi:uncharacterized protein (TIGR02246 family)